MWAAMPHVRDSYSSRCRKVDIAPDYRKREFTPLGEHLALYVNRGFEDSGGRQRRHNQTIK